MSVKSKHFSDEKRQILVESLVRQYKHLSPNVFTKTQINALKQASTFTVTTGHQLNLMGGPLYFLYKIISVINLAKVLKEKYPKHTFVPCVI